MPTPALKGRFITVEGIDGSGKTCNLAFIKTLLTQAGKPVLCTREPGGTPVGEEIRDILLRKRTPAMDAFSELLLLAAARAEHLTRQIRPALARGEWVLCDRFNDATYAYQGGGRCLDLTTLHTLETLIQGELQPDLTILLDLPVETGQARSKLRQSQDRFDQETLAFFQRVRATYLERAAIYPERIRVIDAACSLNAVQTAITQVISGFFNSKLL